MGMQQINWHIAHCSHADTAQCRPHNAANLLGSAQPGELCRDAEGKLLLDLKDLVGAFCIQELVEPEL